MARNMKCPTSGKDVHFTATAAEKSIAQYKRNRGVSLRTYRCPTCKFWHLTKSRGPRTTQDMFAGIPGVRI